MGGDAVGIVLERAPTGTAMGGMNMSNALAAAMGTDAGAAAGMIGGMQAQMGGASASSSYGGAYGGGGASAYGGADPPAASGNVGLALDMIEADVVMGKPLIIKPTASFSSNGAVNKLLSDPNAKWTVHKLANRVSFMRQVSRRVTLFRKNTLTTTIIICVTKCKMFNIACILSPSRTGSPKFGTPKHIEYRNISCPYQSSPPLRNR